jgi:hypothetical protein
MSAGGRYGIFVMLLGRVRSSRVTLQHGRHIHQTCEKYHWVTAVELSKMEIRLLKDIIACQARRQGISLFRSGRFISPSAITTQNVAKETLYACQMRLQLLISHRCGVLVSVRGSLCSQKSIKGFSRVAYDELYKQCFQQILTVAAQEEHRKTNC